MEKRCSFELFKSNVCHWLKEEGDIDFLIQVLESDLIRKYYKITSPNHDLVQNLLIFAYLTFLKVCQLLPLALL